jgi:hypothetical protein
VRRHDLTLRCKLPLKLPLLIGTDAAASHHLDWKGEGEEADVSHIPALVEQLDDGVGLITTGALASGPEELEVWRLAPH